MIEKALQRLGQVLTCPVLPSVNPAILAGIFSILGMIVFAFILAVWYHCRNRKARKLAAAGQIEEKKDGPTVVR